MRRLRVAASALTVTAFLAAVASDGRSEEHGDARAPVAGSLIEIQAGDKTLEVPTARGKRMDPSGEGAEGPQRGLEVTVQASPEPKEGGDRLAFRVKIRNHGPDEVRGLAVDFELDLGEDPLPQRFPRRAGAPSVAGLVGCHRDGDRLWCDLWDLGPGQSTASRVEVAIPLEEPPGSVTLTAIAHGGLLNAMEARGSATAPFTSASGLAVQVSDGSDGFSSGSAPFVHTIQVRNRGTPSSSSVQVDFETTVRRRKMNAPTGSWQQDGTTLARFAIRPWDAGGTCTRKASAESAAYEGCKVAVGESGVLETTERDVLSFMHRPRRTDRISLVGRVKEPLPPNERWEVVTRAWRASAPDEVASVTTPLWSHLPVRLIAARSRNDRGGTFVEVEHVRPEEEFQVFAVWMDEWGAHSGAHPSLVLRGSADEQRFALEAEVDCRSIAGFVGPFGPGIGDPTCLTTGPITLQRTGRATLSYTASESQSPLAPRLALTVR